MNIRVIPDNKDEHWDEFTMYGMEFIPEGRIIHNDEILLVSRMTWDDDNGEVILEAHYYMDRVLGDDTNLKIDNLIRSGQKLQAIKIYKEYYSTGLKDAKDWCDNRERELN